MKLPRVRAQTLPAYTADNAPATPSGRVTPTIRSIEVGYAERDRPAVYRAMVEALIYNLTFIQDMPHIGTLKHVEQLGMMHNAGRCLWGWSSLPSPYFEEGIEKLKAFALRPTSLFPMDMQELSPRFACLLLLSNFSKIERDIIRATESQGLTPPAKVSLAFVLSCVDYGAPLLRPYSRLEPLHERSGYNDAQSAILAVADSGSLPFSHYQLVVGTYEADQAKRINAVHSGVIQDLQEVGQALGRVIDSEDLPVMLQEPLPAAWYAKAADMVMIGNWAELRLGDEPGDPDEDLLVIVARAIIRRIGCEGRQQQLDARTLLGLSLLSGISPAAFIRHAIKDFKRRGVTYVSLAEAAELSDLIRLLDVPVTRDAARRDVLVRELDSLANQLGAAHAAKKDWEVELPQKLLKAWTPKHLAFEWIGTSGAQSSNKSEEAA